jgi:hypothetical protein
MFLLLLVLRRQDQGHHKSVSNMYTALANDGCSNISYPVTGRFFPPVAESATALLAIRTWGMARYLAAGCSMQLCDHKM